MKSMTIKELRAATDNPKHGHVGPLYWLAVRGYGIDNVTGEFSEEIVLMNKRLAVEQWRRGTRIVGPAYFPRPN